MLAARQLAFARAGHPVFRGIDLTLDAGHALAVTGPNGSGKSTLLRVLAGLLPPATGELTWAGRPVRAGDPAFGQSVGYVGHANGIDPDLSATEHLVYAARLAGCAVTAEAARAALAKAGLGRVADAAVRTLSQGQRRRAALARLSLVPRTLWLLDEPLTSLDDDAAARFTQRLDAHLASGGMAVVATHRPLSLAHGATATLCLGRSA
ncbi:cytochrome c biogenesis heme-transporting ATPase CcmA [Cupriavidus sp. RAF12]|uniref:cytochrome c biogenesis heme-transporting ATPase CcmA n=1 Tax=Cupriavidus sp. RAF12 TaxID=3233050 RepID=UPI003F8E7647